MCNFFFFFSFLIIITLCVLPSLVFPWLWELINLSFEMNFAMKLGKNLRVAPKTRKKTSWVSATVWVKCKIIIIMSWNVHFPCVPFSFIPIFLLVKQWKTPIFLTFSFHHFPSFLIIIPTKQTITVQITIFLFFFCK